MKAGARAPKAPARGAPRRQSASYLLFFLGGLFVLGAAAYATQTMLHAWLTAQDRYLVAHDTAPLAIRDLSSGSVPASIPELTVVRSSPAEDPEEVAAATRRNDASAPAGTSPSMQGGVSTIPVPTEEATAPYSEPANMPQPTASLTPQPAATTAAPVRIRIPTIGVNRSIIEVPLTYNSRTKTWERDYEQLFRRAGKDLVGHWGGSASPGQPGNMILVGHNYGHGYNGVFLRLGRLKAGQRVEVVSASGERFTYRVTEVKTIRWSKKNQQELMKHLPYLSVEGPERLTLVTCGGSNWAPFPDRVYVVAEPAP